MKYNEDLNKDYDKNDLSNSFDEENTWKNYKNFNQQNEFENNEEEKKENIKNVSFEIIENLIDDQRISKEQQEKNYLPTLK